MPPVRVASSQPAGPAAEATALPRGWSRRTARFVFAVGLLALGGWIAREFLTPLLWSVVIVMAVWPLYRYCRDRLPEGARSVAAPLLFTALTAMVVLVPLAFVATEMAREAQHAVAWAKQAQQEGVPPPDWISAVPLLGDAAARWWDEHLATPEAAQAGLGEIDAGRVAGWTRSLGTVVLHRVLLFLVMLLALYPLFRHGERIGCRILDFVDRLLGDPGERLAERMVSAMRGTVNGTVLVALGQGTLIGIAYVVAGVPDPILFGALTVACAMIPSGAWVAFTLAALVFVGQGGSTLAAAGLWAFGAVVMLVGDNFVQPAVIGGSVRLPLLWALVGILGGIQTFGIIGLFLGPVIMAALLTLWREWALGEPA